MSLSHILVLYYHTVLAYPKTTVHLSVGGMGKIFTSPLHDLVNQNLCSLE